MADEYVFNSSQSPTATAPFVYKDKQFVIINDSQNGSYGSGQIVWDCASFSNSGKTLSLAESFIVIPIGVNMAIPTTVGATKAAENIYAMSLKNSVLQCCHSLELQISNNTVIPLQPYLNEIRNFDILTSFSSEDVQTWGSSIMFEKDSCDTWNYNTTGNGEGYGMINNRISGLASYTTPAVFAGATSYPIVAANGAGSSANIYSFDPAVQDRGTTVANSGLSNTFSQNTGRLKRMLNMSVATDDTASGSNPLGKLYQAGAINTIGKTRCTTFTGTQTSWVVMAKIPLKFLHDFFKKCPLVKNMYMKLTLNTNTQTTAALPITAAGVYSGIPTITTINGTYPFMISPLSNGGHTGLVASTDVQTITVSTGVALAGVVGFPFTSARLYGCLCTLSPQTEQMYFANPLKTVSYLDSMTFSMINNISAGGTVNQILSNGMSRCRYLVIIPFLNSASNAAIQHISSPFDSCPGTTCPAAISGLNVAISGTNVFQEYQQYSYLNYLTQLKGINALCGGLDTGLNSGTLSEYEYENNYKYFVVNLAHHSREDDDVARQITVNFVNLNKVAMDYRVHVVFEKSLNLDVEKGVLVI